jgi:hypothetical protein
MGTVPDIAIRELDRRNGDDIEARLVWNPRTNVVSIAVQDERAGRELAFDVDPADAPTAFHHPYAFATNLKPHRNASRPNHKETP